MKHTSYLIFNRLSEGGLSELVLLETMQWRRRHCCAQTAKCLYFLSLLGLLVFLVLQVGLTKLTCTPRCRDHPVVSGGGERLTTNLSISAPNSAQRIFIIPPPTSKAEANITSPEKEVVPPTQAAKTTATNTTQSVEGDLSSGITHGPFTYIINEPNKCANSSPAPFLVFLIAVEVRQVEARNAIRQTWGNESVVPGLIRLFLLGKKEGELGLLQQRTLESESEKYHDIIQQDFHDTYKNLTLKTLMGMNWVAIHCPGASYAMKTDSDMFVNTEYLIYKLLRPQLKAKENYFTGMNMKDYSPIRNPKSKWYMAPELYKGIRYPPFCSGTGYVFSGDLAEKIYRISTTVDYLSLEDVFVGLCLAKLQIDPTNPPSRSLFNNWRVPYSSCRYSQLITSHGIHPNDILKYWHHMHSNKQNPCISPVRAGRLH